MQKPDNTATTRFEFSFQKYRDTAKDRSSGRANHITIKKTKITQNRSTNHHHGERHEFQASIAPVTSNRRQKSCLLQMVHVFNDQYGGNPIVHKGPEISTGLIPIIIWVSRGPVCLDIRSLNTYTQRN